MKARGSDQPKKIYNKKSRASPHEQSYNLINQNRAQRLFSKLRSSRLTPYQSHNIICERPFVCFSFSYF